MSTNLSLYAVVIVQLRMQSRELRDDAATRCEAPNDSGAAMRSSPRNSPSFEMLSRASFHLRDHARRVLAERGAGFRERGAARRAREQLRVELGLESREPAAHDRFRQPQTAGRARHAAGVGNGHKSLEIR